MACLGKSDKMKLNLFILASSKPFGKMKKTVNQNEVLGLIKTFFTIFGVSLKLIFLSSNFHYENLQK